jgi:hypothetical protein
LLVLIGMSQQQPSANDLQQRQVHQSSQPQAATPITQRIKVKDELWMIAKRVVMTSAACGALHLLLDRVWKSLLLGSTPSPLATRIMALSAADKIYLSERYVSHMSLV